MEYEEYTMKKSKIVLIAVLTMAVVLIFSGCGKKQEAPAFSASPVPAMAAPKAALADGNYFAIDRSEAAPNWRYYVELAVSDGAITEVNWSAVNPAGMDKKTVDKAGQYNMVKYGGAQAEWYQQAEKVEEQLIKTQSADLPDAIGGVSIGFDEFKALVKQALASPPAVRGPYADGEYYAEEGAFASSGWKYFVSLLVRNGNIVHANWSAVDKDGRDKRQVAASGEYGMIKVSSLKKEWHEQALEAEMYLLKTQDPKQIALKADGKTDAIAGATITVGVFFDLAEAALANGPRTY